MLRETIQRRGGFERMLFGADGSETPSSVKQYLVEQISWLELIGAYLSFRGPPSTGVRERKEKVPTARARGEECKIPCLARWTGMEGVREGHGLCVFNELRNRGGISRRCYPTQDQLMKSRQ